MIEIKPGPLPSTQPSNSYDRPSKPSQSCAPLAAGDAPASVGGDGEERALAAAEVCFTRAMQAMTAAPAPLPGRHRRMSL